jgi:hypothetical protein
MAESDQTTQIHFLTAAESVYGQHFCLLARRVVVSQRYCLLIDLIVQSKLFCQDKAATTTLDTLVPLSVQYCHP